MIDNPFALCNQELLCLTCHFGDPWSPYQRWRRIHNPARSLYIHTSLARARWIKAFRRILRLRYLEQVWDRVGRFLLEAGYIHTWIPPRFR